jgi:UDP-N-acetyl-D-glucosamine dehydrogenase
VDSDARRATALDRGESYIEDVPADRLAAVSHLLSAGTGYAPLAECDAVMIAVPTPLTRNREPDLGPMVAAGTSLAEVLREGQLVVLESTTYPGTTRERLAPLLEESGLAAGRDFNLAFSPERIDPGRTDYTGRRSRAAWPARRARGRRPRPRRRTPRGRARPPARGSPA